MDDIVKKISEAILRVADPDDKYNQEDFHKDFGEVKSQYKTDYNKIAVEYANKSTNEDPAYMTAGSSAFDLRADLGSEELVIPPSEARLVPTGLYFKLPNNFEIQVRPRSGLALKHGISVLNTPGTVDADYRGEVKVILINHGKEPFTVKHGDRIAQAVIATVINTSNAIKLMKVSEISEDTERGAGGFGHTGIS
jgi:dUTP pyrophosphatase